MEYGLRYEAQYARQSVVKKDSISIEFQIKEGRKHLLNPDIEPRVYKESKSGKDIAGRDELKRLIEDIEAGIISRVIVYKLDRISRNLLDFINIWNIFEKYNVEFVSCNEHFDTSSEMGKAMLKIAMIFAEMERNTIIDRVRDNFFERASQGYYIGGYAPFGYKKVDIIWQGKKTAAFARDDDIVGNVPKTKAEWISWMFHTYATTDLSLGKIANMLVEYELPSVRNTKGGWSSPQLGRTLRQTAYVKADASVYMYLKSKGAIMNQSIEMFTGDNGCYLYAPQSDYTAEEQARINRSKRKPGRTMAQIEGAYVTLAPHEGIVPSDIWLTCQYKLDQNKQIKCDRSGKNSWLIGLMKCGYCGTGITPINNRRRMYIGCYGKRTNICTGRKRVWMLDEVEAFAETAILKFLEQRNNIAIQAMDSIEEKQIQSRKDELAKLQLKYDSKFDTLADFPKGTRGYEKTMQILKDIQSEIDNAKGEIVKALNHQYMSKRSEIDTIDIPYVIENWSSLSFEEKKSVARKVIKKVVVAHPDDEEERVYVHMRDNTHF